MPATEAKRRPRAIVVDDQHDAAESFVRMLRAMGCEANFVTNPFMAVEAAGRMKAEVVFLDVGMPGIDGYELARILRAKHGWEGLKIVAVTGHAADKDRTGTRKAGFDAHVVKPVDPQLIESMLRTLFPDF